MKSKDHNAHHARAKKLTVAHQLFSTPELLVQVLSHVGKGDLARMSTVSKLWYWECAKYLWATCTQLQNLEFYVRPEQQADIALLVRHLDTKDVRQLWTPNKCISMPNFPNLRSVSINTSALASPFDTQCPSQLVPAGLEKLSLTTETSSAGHDNATSPTTTAPWLVALHQSCPELRVLTLDMNLTPTAREDLELPFLSAPIEELMLGPLISSAIGDWTVATVLSQQGLRIFELDAPMTKEALQILKSQCDTTSVLHNLERLSATFDVNAEETMASLFPLIPNLTLLDVTLSQTPNETPWSPNTTLFSSISMLKHLHTLNMRIHTISAGNVGEDRIYTSITGADLVALTSLPLRSLSIQPHRSEWYMLELRQFSAADYLHILRSWSQLEHLKLELCCKEIVCASAQADLIFALRSKMEDDCLGIGELIIRDDLLDPSVWLGNNSNFCPDPLQWEPRQLHHSDQAQALEALSEVPEEEEFLVWGVESEDQHDAESVSGNIAEERQTEHDGSEVPDDTNDARDRRSVVPARAGCF
jgi:hypothetical protein